jgi:hypothetical protein
MVCGHISETLPTIGLRFVTHDLIAIQRASRFSLQSVMRVFFAFVVSRFSLQLVMRVLLNLLCGWLQALHQKVKCGIEVLMTNATDLQSNLILQKL